MSHHWRPSDHLEPSARTGEWTLSDRGMLIGTVETGLVAGRRAFRALTRAGDLLGYAADLEDCCDRLWAWWVRTRKGAPMAAWPWPPIRIGEEEWVVMRIEAAVPKAVIRRFRTERGDYYRVVTWAPRSEDRVLLGRYRTLSEADAAVLTDPPQDLRRGPDKDRRRA